MAGYNYIKIVHEGEDYARVRVGKKEIEIQEGIGIIKTLLKKIKADECSICGRYRGEFGNNAQPINDGRCCDECSEHRVIPARCKRDTVKLNEVMPKVFPRK